MQYSFWERDSYFAPADVVIIGSGIVGLNAAWHIKRTRPKMRVTVLERGFLPTGASSRNAGFACFGSPSELLYDLQTNTEEQVFGLVEKRWQGLQLLLKNLGARNIGYHRYGGYELFMPGDERYQACLEQLPYFNKQLASIIGHNEVYRQSDNKIRSFGFKGVAHLLECTFEGQIHTGQMITALTRKAQAAGVQILCGQEVTKLADTGNGVELQLSGGISLQAKRAIVCTNGFARQLLPVLPVVPARAQVLITKPIPGLKLRGTYHFDEGFYYFRNIGNRVLFGGARNLDFETEETTEFGLTEKVQNRLENLLEMVILPGKTFEVEQRWSGIMGMGPGKAPIIEHLSDHVVCAVRLSGMGVAIGSLVGRDAAELALQS